MKIILVGYPGSQKIRKASKYLIDKYLIGFDVDWLEYKGEIEGWSEWLADNLSCLSNEQIILALDDYLISAPLEVSQLKSTSVCCKLCECTNEENEEYPVTTQYTLWNRKYLVSLLEQTTTPWDFEITGSRIFKEQGQQMQHLPILKYNVHSALSKRWEGIRLDGLNEEDVKAVQVLL